MSDLSQVLVVSVSYNSATILPDMLSTLPSACRVVVVDNGGEDVAALQSLSEAHGFDLVRSEKNLGFGAGCNLGAARGKEPYVFFLNPDAKVENGALERLVDAADAYPEAVAFNPMIIKEDGSALVRGVCRILPKQIMAMAQSQPLDKDVELPLLSGAALLVRRAAFEAVGGFDEKIFLYFEDDDLTVRLRAAGGRLMRIARARIAHHGGQSTGSSEQMQRFKNYQWARARIYVTRKHQVKLPFLRGLLEGLKALNKPIRDEQKQSLNARFGLVTGALSTIWDGGANAK